jgi:hypothetical protein
MTDTPSDIPALVALLSRLVDKILTLDERLDEIEIELLGEISRKRDRHEKLPIRLIANNLDPKTHAELTAEIAQLKSFSCAQATKLSQLTVSFGDLATRALQSERSACG